MQVRMKAGDMESPQLWSHSVPAAGVSRKTSFPFRHPFAIRESETSKSLSPGMRFEPRLFNRPKGRRLASHNLVNSLRKWMNNLVQEHLAISLSKLQPPR